MKVITIFIACFLLLSIFLGVSYQNTIGILNAGTNTILKGASFVADFFGFTVNDFTVPLASGFLGSVNYMGKASDVGLLIYDNFLPPNLINYLESKGYKYDIRVTTQLFYTKVTQRTNGFLESILVKEKGVKANFPYMFRLEYDIECEATNIKSFYYVCLGYVDAYEYNHMINTFDDTYKLLHYSNEIEDVYYLMESGEFSTKLRYIDSDLDLMLMVDSVISDEYSGKLEYNEPINTMVNVNEKIVEFLNKKGE